MNKYWTVADKENLSRAISVAELAPIAIGVIKRMPKPVGMVSGPITTGGFGSVEKNLEIFAGVIAELQRDGLTVFSQLPFESFFVQVWREWRGEGYCMEILEKFYQPVFESGEIGFVHFIPGWEASFGARFEHEQCRRLRIQTLPVPPQIVSALLQGCGID